MRKQVYSQVHGLIWVDTNEKYNGRTIEEIEKLPFTGWSDHDKKLYLKNCADVISLQLTGDFGAAESIKNSNFYIADASMARQGLRVLTCRVEIK